MSQSAASGEVEAARKALHRALAILQEGGHVDADEIVDRARAAMAELETAELLAGGGTRPAIPGKGAKGRILAYLQTRGVDAPVTGAELRRISGIQEWARRVRELRVEEGWDIRYDGHAYRLKSDQRNREVAEAWRLASSIRDTSLSARDRILRFLQTRVGQVVHSELIDYVSGTRENTRLMRELRVELGYSISSHIDRPELKPDEYVLESESPVLKMAERQVSETLRKTVFERDGYRCVLCDRGYGSEMLLAAYHLVPQTEGLSDADPEDFVTLCQDDRGTITDEQLQELLKRRRRRSETGR